MAENYIYIGDNVIPAFTFTGDQIERLVCENAVSISGDELSSDALDVDVFYEDTSGSLRNVEYATPLYYYSDNTFVGKYFIEKIIRSAGNKFSIQATSLIGLIAKEQHYGGMYTGQTFPTVINDILYGNGFNDGRYELYDSCTSGLGSHSSSATTITTEYVVKKGARMYADFEAVAPDWTGATTSGGYDQKVTRVCGSTNYYIALVQRRPTGTNDVHYHVRVRYGTSSTYIYNLLADDVNPIAGNGSRFAVDVDPTNNRIRVEADCVDPNNSSVVRHISRGVRDMPVPTGSFQTTASSYPVDYTSIKHYAYRMYDAGKLSFNLLYIKDNNNSRYLWFDTVSGRTATAGTYFTAGTLVCSARDTRYFERAADLNISYGEGVDAIQIYGWLSPGLKREALHQILLAENVRLIKTGSGGLLFTAVPKVSSGDISSDNVYNTGSVEREEVAKSIRVTENAYLDTGGTSQKIFDNSDSPAVEGEYVAMFDNAPISGTPVGSGVTIVAYNCNAAIVTGRGTITGVPYLHSKSVLGYDNPAAPDGMDISVTDVGIITDVNSDNVMKHLKAYYAGGVNKVKSDIVYNGEKCGLKYGFLNAFSESEEGNLSKTSLLASSFIKATCEFITGYIPPKIGGYENFVIKLSGETWTIPDDVKSQQDPTVRLNIIGTGTSGLDGEAGAPGASGSVSGSSGTPGTGGAGGAGGLGGSGGKIYVVTVNVSGADTITVSDSGGDIEVKTKTGSTTINTYSSASGNVNQNGFTNVFTGITYALPGKDGIAGGNGGAGGFKSSSFNPTIAENGQDVTPHVGGNYYRYPTDIEYTDVGGSVVAYYYGSSGGGGGASYSADGGDAYKYGSGTIALVGQISEPYNYYSGGNGASADPADAGNPTYGSGGNGGHGGGGGGGGAVDAYKTAEGSRVLTGRKGGSGGFGGAGTPGQRGCVIIYY